MSRKRLFEIIEIAEEGDRASHVYDWSMIVTIILSLVPLTVKNPSPVLNWLEWLTCLIFIIDYLLRLITADYKLNRGAWSFVRYPFTFMALVDMLCILPTFSIVGEGVKALKVLRMMRALRVFRAVKIFRYSESIEIIGRVIKKQKEPLIAVCVLSLGYVLLSALIVFNVEPDTFDNFFHAVYWATVSLTTMGYGDIYPVSTAGQVVTMVSSFIGIAIVALPSGIITAGYMNEMKTEVISPLQIDELQEIMQEEETEEAVQTESV